MPKYYDFMRAFNRDKGYNSFYGSDKREFLDAWQKHKATGHLAPKREIPEIIVQPMEEALPTISEKKTGLKIEVKPEMKQRAILNERQKGQKAAKAPASTKGYHGEGERLLARDLRNLYGDYMLNANNKKISQAALDKMTKTEVLDKIQFDLGLTVKEVEDFVKPIRAAILKKRRERQKAIEEQDVVGKEMRRMNYEKMFSKK
jgi:hypothetical protein